jgi:RHS repeat-associated protein
MTKHLLGALIAMAMFAAPASAAEICGNGVDDDLDGSEDDGCFPAMTTGVCESPLSCGETGMISPSTGSLHYSLPPDVAPRVPWGIGIGMRRFYTSAYAPAPGAPVWKKPLGERWQHTYMTWLDLSGSGAGSTISLHTSQGRDVLFTFVSGTGCADVDYAPQPGFHVQYMRIVKSSCVPIRFEMKLLTGEVLQYSNAGRLTGIVAPGIAPPTEAVLLTYDGNSQVSTVTDGSGTRRLLFSYSSNLLSTVQFQINFSGTWTTQHTTSYSYTSGALTSVTIGGQLAQQMTYTSSFLTKIADGAGKVIVSFAYDSTVASRAVRADTQSGMIGVELSSSRSTCSGKTVVYFNLGATTNCTDDSNCSAGQMCGGKTGTGATGKCFRGARCLTLTSPHEDLVTTVAPLAPAGHTCDGACTDVAQYIWNTGGGSLNLAAIQDPAGFYETRAFNANGLPVWINYGDPDSSPDSQNGNRTVYLRYDNPNFPGKVTEIRRRSELDNDASLCNESSIAGCARTLIFYSDFGKPSKVSRNGTTLGWSAGSVSETLYQNDTDYQYDSQGRLTQVSLSHGTADDLTKFDYWSGSGDVLKDGMLRNVKRELVSGAPGTYVTSSADAYDFWGNPTTLTDSDTDATNSTGTVTCLTFSASRGVLTSRREAMAAQTTCATSNGADLTTTWARDSALRLTQLTRPDGSCMFYEWGHSDSARPAHLLRTKRRDDCNAASSGERQEYVYDGGFAFEGLVTEIQTYDAAGVLTAKQPFTYFDSRKLEKMINPVDTSKFTGLSYDSRGLVSQIDAAGNLGKTVFNRSGVPGQEGRVTSVDRYKTSSLFDSWSLLYDWTGNQEKVTDGDALPTETVRDDLGRVVKLISADMSLPTVRIYDNANRLRTVIKAQGGAPGVQRVHSYSYDRIGRLVTADMADLSGLAGNCIDPGLPETNQQYDLAKDLGGNPSCPMGVTCSRTGGRLAYVKQILMCSSDLVTYPDGSIDQETWYGYDDAGRVIREYIKDDTGRVANHAFTWTKSGLATVTLPSTAVVGFTYGSTGNSDTDLISAVWRTSTSTPVVNAIIWFPYGPLKQYNQQNQISNKLQRTAIARNLAYRLASVAVENQSNGTDTFSVTIAEDAKGRVTKRDYTLAASGVTDSFFLYDDQDRVTCETTNLVSSCPLTGSNLKNNHAQGFTNAGDWKKLLRPIPGSTGLTNDFSLTPGTHQISQINQSDGSPTFGVTQYQYDARGNRLSDAPSHANLSHARRDYVFDGRDNLINVHGWYYTGSAWHEYDVASAFDAKNRRVFKQFLDTSTNAKAQWFFYYDPLDRLTEVRYTPNTATPTTFSTFQLFWLGDRLVTYWQTDSGGATSKRYVATDEAGRPIDMWSWPPSGNASRVWAINPSAWGFDTNAIGSAVFQPVLFAGQYLDSETAALEDPSGTPVHRPGVAANGARTFDPFTGAYLQFDPAADESWSTYVYAGSNPVGNSDPDGRLFMSVSVSLQIWGDAPVCTGPTIGNIEESLTPWGQQSYIDCLANPTYIDGNFGPGGGGPWVQPEPEPTTYTKRKFGIARDCMYVASSCAAAVPTEHQRCLKLRCEASYCFDPWWGYPPVVNPTIISICAAAKSEYNAEECGAILASGAALKCRVSIKPPCPPGSISSCGPGDLDFPYNFTDPAGGAGGGLVQVMDLPQTTTF